jgi:hypothetical protein
MMHSRGNERRDWFGKIKWVYFGRGQFAFLNRVEKINIGGATGTKRFHCQGAAARVAQMLEEQAGKQCLADAGIGAGNEDYSRSHVPRVLTMDYRDGTDKNRHG